MDKYKCNRIYRSRRFRKEHRSDRQKCIDVFVRPYKCKFHTLGRNIRMDNIPHNRTNYCPLVDRCKNRWCQHILSRLDNSCMFSHYLLFDKRHTHLHIMNHSFDKSSNGIYYRRFEFRKNHRTFLPQVYTLQQIDKLPICNRYHKLGPRKLHILFSLQGCIPSLLGRLPTDIGRYNAFFPDICAVRCMKP